MSFIDRGPGLRSEIGTLIVPDNPEIVLVGCPMERVAAVWPTVRPSTPIKPNATSRDAIMRILIASIDFEVFNYTEGD